MKDEVNSFDLVIEQLKGKLINEEKKQLTPLGVIVCVSMCVQLMPLLIKVWFGSFKR